jgi:leader peptidase (prepilin peptidase)/N-methyltransferase
MVRPAIDALLSPWCLGLIGLLVGSFLNVVIHRLPLILERDWLSDFARYMQESDALRRVLGTVSPEPDWAEIARAGRSLTAATDALPLLSLSKPRSRCPSCGHQLRWTENIPLLSWAWLRARCSACASPISIRYPAVELLTAALFAAVALRFGATAASAVYCLVVAMLIAAALIDFDTTLLPDDLTLPLIGLGLIAAWLQWTPVSLADASLGALFGYLSLWSVSRTYRLVRRVEGMAEGDFKLLAGLGAVLGWQMLLAIILLASAVGSAVGIYMIAGRGHQREVPIPFGPYLAGGGLAALFFGADLSRWIAINSLFGA